MFYRNLIQSALGRLNMFRARHPALYNPAVDHFLLGMETISHRAGGGAYAFADTDNTCRGWVQFIIRSDQRVEIHRLWTLKPGRGNGSAMLKAVCDMADRYGVELALKALPFGRKPYPLNPQQLHAWYRQYGFVPGGKRLIRKPTTSVGAPQIQMTQDNEE